MTCLVTGASGFIGRRLVEILLNSGTDVTCAVRTGQAAAQLPRGGRAIVIGNMDEMTDWSEAVRGSSIVIHLAARAHVLQERAADPLAEFSRANVGGTLSLLRAAETEGVRRLVFMSSVGVLGDNTTDSAFNDETPPSPVSPYACSKLEAEDALRHAAVRVEVVVLRPPLVYGPRNPGNFRRLLHLVSSGIPLPFASVQNHRSLVYVDNLVGAIRAAAMAPSIGGECFLVTDPGSPSLPYLVASMARSMGRRARLLSFPPPLLAAGLRLLGREAMISSLLGSLVVDGSRFAARTAWVPAVPLEEGLLRTVNWYNSMCRG